MLDIQESQAEKEAHNYAQRERNGDREAQSDYLRGYEDAITTIFNYLGLKYGLLEEVKKETSSVVNER